MSSRTHWALWSALLLVVACQQPPDLSADIDELAVSINSSRTATCNCPQDVGFSTVVECDEALGRLTDANKKCIADVFEGHEEIAQEYLECALGVWRDYGECLEANESCEEGVFEVCNTASTEAINECPQLPDDVQEAYTLCLV